MKRHVSSFFSGLLFILTSGVIDSVAASDDAFQFYEEEAKVTTALRRPQLIQDAPVAVEVITQEEIRASGVTNIWDLLRFRPGMNVEDGHQTILGNRAIVSIRGFAESLARNILILVDGRRVYSTESGGVYWAQLPYSPADIERIEIIRGPNAALYGTGAGLGVINIITKKPEGATTASIQVTEGNQESVLTSESVTGAFHTVNYRLSHTYQGQGGFDSAADGTTANDFFRGHKFNLRLGANLAKETDLEFFAGGGMSDSGISNNPTAQDKFKDNFQMLKFHVKVSNRSDLEFLSSRNDYWFNISPTATGTVDELQYFQYDEELLHRIAWGAGNYTAYGFAYHTSQVISEFTFMGQPMIEEDIWSGFLNQTLQVKERITLVGAVAWETSSKGKPHLNYQATSLWNPVENQAFRASYSVAHTIPNLRQRFSEVQFTPTVARIGNPQLEPFKITSYEIGYRSTWMERHLEAESNLFYTNIDGMDDDVDLGPWARNSAVEAIGFLNSNNVIARGVELQVKYHASPKDSIYLNYTYERLVDISGNQGEITENIPPLVINFGGMKDLGQGFSGSFNLGYKEGYFVTNIADDLSIPVYWRLDARLAYRPAEFKATQFYLAGQNLLTGDHLEYADGLTVPRTYMAGIITEF
jgi:iron complex outermembrane receptor protein